MNRLKQLPVGRQVLITFGILCAILLIIGGLFFFSMRTIERSNELQQARALGKLALIDDTAQDIGQMQADVLEQVLASDLGEKKSLDRTVRSTEKINLKELAGYRQSIETEKEIQLYDRVMRARKVYWEQTQQVLAFGFENRDAEATKIITAKQAPAYDDYLAATNNLIKYVETGAEDATGATARFISQIRTVGDALAGIAIFIAVGSGFAVVRIVGLLKGDNRLLQIEVADRKRAEETSRESEEKFHQLADNITDVFWMTSPDLQQMHYISAGYELIWGRSTESLYNHPHQWVEAILPEERERVFAIFGTLMGSQSKVSVEYRIARPDGTVRWVHDRGFQVRDAAGNLVRLAGLVTDITERKRIEETLRESEERFSGAFEHAPIGVALASPEGRWLKVNRALCEVVGYSEAEMCTRTFKDITYPEDVDMSLENARRLIAGEIRSYQSEKRYVHARGNPVPVLLNVSLVRDGLSQPLYFIAQIQDITERKRSEAELESAHRRLLDLSRQAGMAEVATSVLHNVGNVLNSVNISATLVIDGLRTSQCANLGKVAAMLEEHAANLGAFITSDSKGKLLPGFIRQLSDTLIQEQETAATELESLRKHIDHIKDIVSKQQSYAKISGLSEVVDVVDLVEDSLHLNAAALTRHEMELIRDYQKVPAIIVEKHKVLQILVNLIRNAKHACDDGGQAVKRVTVRVAAGEGCIRISVIDNGIGVPPENLVRIFNHGFTTRKNGHGFGLHSGALAAEEMGGSLTVESKGLGHGAAFTLEIPRPAPEDPK